MNKEPQYDETHFHYVHPRFVAVVFMNELKFSFLLGNELVLSTLESCLRGTIILMNE
ncbi:hypothetical protein KIN20_034125 [Parelaphostrongylus tenuis]|uniref:Uncharacterized protein n=1 Tax=Parelaphostrongylus tenuis TaxID=148309 RepID=A0AAD5WIT3_PARTN|nr:hypothetical protein KIN20_034125 [Parelaphostrongylus tenuis]